MSQAMQEFAIMAAQVRNIKFAWKMLIKVLLQQDAIANFTTEQEIASSIKAKFEQQYPST